MIRAQPCKICGGAAPCIGAVDFNKNCEGPASGLSVSGIPIPYHRCVSCGFLFTCVFDRWSHADFKREIYNDKYILVDPCYETVRPLNNAAMTDGLFGRHRAALHVLDYGGGNDRFAAELRQRGFGSARTYDPFSEAHATLPQATFDMVTCFETFEHVPDPLGMIRQILALVDPSGLVLFSTYLLQRDAGLDEAYVAPRNGHVSIFSRTALARAWSRHGWNLATCNNVYHIAFREIPDFARHFLVPPPHQ